MRLLRRGLSLWGTCLLAWGGSALAAPPVCGPSGLGKPPTEVPIALVFSDLRPLDFEPAALERAWDKGKADGLACLSELGQ